MDKNEFVSRFGDYIEAGQASLFVGAGLSGRAGYPNWQELTDRFREELGIDPIDDLPQLVQYYEDNAAGRDVVVAHVRDVLKAVQMPERESEPLRPHRLLAALPITSYWTTNYDPLLEDTIPGAIALTEDEDLAGSWPGDKRVLKMHGSIRAATGKTKPGPLVISRGDYDRYALDHPRFFSLLQAEFLTRSFLFLGFSFRDPNLDLVLRFARIFTQTRLREHFAVMRRPQNDPAELRLFELRTGELSRAGISVIEIDEHHELDGFLQQLVARCRPMRVYVSGSQPGEKTPAVEGAYPTAPLSEDLETVAKQLGGRLADTRIKLMAGGEVGATVGYEMLRQLRLRETYDSDRFTLIRRAKEEALDAPNQRLGRILFTRDNPADLRTEAFDEVRAVLVLGGGEGTHEEVRMAIERGMGVVPLAMTGGVAKDIWAMLDADFENYELGGRPVSRADFDLLDHSDATAATSAATRLLERALFLGEP